MSEKKSEMHPQTADAGANGKRRAIVTEEKKMENITFRLTAELKQALKGEGERQNRSVSQQVTFIIREFFQNQCRDQRQA